MRLSKKAIKEFKKIYYQEFGERISDEEAREMGVSLLSLFRAVYKPVPKNDDHRPKDEYKDTLG